MNTKHTPGPWIIGDCHPDNGAVRITSKKDHVCVLLNLPDDEASEEENREQVKANARLIAAAPELLSALKDLFKQCAMTHRYWGDGDNTRQADEAVERAKNLINTIEGA